MVDNRRRKKAIRARMAETGENYTRAMRELDKLRVAEQPQEEREHNAQDELGN